MKGRHETLGFVIADVYRLLRRAFRKHLEGSSSLTLAQAQALVCVARNEGVRQVVLAEMLDIQPITLARLVDQLVESGAVERRPDPADRRAHNIYLTAGAEPHLAAIEDVAAAIRKEALSGLTRSEVKTALRSLDKMRSNLLARG